jgi:long-chain acyl-CoA synthetase
MAWKRWGEVVPNSIEVQEALTGPEGFFELVEEDVRGIPTQVYKNRAKSLRTLAALGLERENEVIHLVHGERRIGFQAVVETSNSVSATLAGIGVGHGDRVAILSANNPEWVYTFWGTVDMGAVLVGLNGWWKADEILYGLADSGAKVLVADRDRFARVADRLDELPELEAVYLIDADPSVVGSAGRRRVAVRPFTSLLTEPTHHMPAAVIGEDDPAVILYTSGTTGRAKGAVSTHRMMIANVQNTFYMTVAASMMWGNNDLGGGGQPVALITSPLFHASGCHSGIVLGMAAGVRIVLTVGRFDPEQALRLIQDEKVTVFTTVPTMVARVVEHPARRQFDLSSVRTVAYGGSPSGSRLQQGVRDTFRNVAMVRNAYGLTESASTVTVNSGPELADRPESVGRPVPGVEIRIVATSGAAGAVGAAGAAGASGAVLGPGEAGEIWLKGAQIMPGYWGRPVESAEVVTDGWLHTGDIGYLDEEGYLFVTDRAKDMIIRGGENVYCVEIEDRLVQHPGVLDAAVIGVAHPVLGEEVKAVVQIPAGSGLTEDAVRAWVREKLADFKVPAYVEFRTDRLPRNATGKLLKNLLRGSDSSSLIETM